MKNKLLYIPQECMDIKTIGEMQKIFDTERKQDMFILPSKFAESIHYVDNKGKLITLWQKK